ncbi:beta-galactosidase [Arthrobacter pigmenti]|uniref:Beta-galactosidase n=1 Tax=Arthrobacter pigmenti TaxID=271432 RepID=A0A846RR98_9MICC|nr:beta-galactosidase [Arthrobacter pigmenti]
MTLLQNDFRPGTEPAGAALTFADSQLARHGQPHRILSGSVHYFRVHPYQWRDRLEKIKALGLNTVDTYVAWNFHQRKPGPPDFTGWRDLGAFIDLAAELGLDAIVRPGPYICAEWDNGGFPAWLTGVPGISLRSSDRRYLEPLAEWFDELMPIIERRQAVHGGPVVAVQLENEYGSYGDDTAYLAWLRDALTSRGIVELIYTADGPTELMLDGGTLEGTMAAATFGSGAHDAAELLRTRRNSEPFLCAEFWNGWFDHWGEKHHTRTPESAASGVAEILAENGSVSLYMAHGGSNFGLWAGANHADGVLQPTVQSYDSDAPIAEDGALTEKFHTIRAALHSHENDDDGALPVAALPAAARRLAPARLAMNHRAGLLETLRELAAPVRSASPLTFEELGLDAGLVLYRSTPMLPRGESRISVLGLHDRAQVFLDGEPLGVLDRGTGEGGLAVVGQGKRVTLEILVENQGRINYGPYLGEHKGILQGVTVGRRLIHGWEQIAVDLEGFDPASLADGPVDGSASGFFETSFECTDPADTFLALPGFVKGFVWINGFLLGRYWEVGPQATYYVPGPLLQAGLNRIVVLELQQCGTHAELREEPDLGSSEQYIESF